MYAKTFIRKYTNALCPPCLRCTLMNKLAKRLRCAFIDPCAFPNCAFFFFFFMDLMFFFFVTL